MPFPLAELTVPGPQDLPRVRVGFMPLTDCAPLVVARELGFDQRHGIRLELRREASWSAIRDRLLSAEIDAAHGLYGQICAIGAGIGGIQYPLAILMGLNQNGQAITLSNRLRGQGVDSGAALKALVRSGRRRPVLAHTYPTGTHALWLHYWLAAQGIDPLKEVEMVTVPPPAMVERLKRGDLDGFCAGEPWSARVVSENLGFTVTTSQQIWPDHPEKVLASTGYWVDEHPGIAQALVRAVLEGARYADQPDNRDSVARWLAQSNYLDTDVSLIIDRLQGRYDDGNGHQWQDPHGIRFHAEGRVTTPISPMPCGF